MVARAVPEHDEFVANGCLLRYAIRVSPRRQTLCLRLYPDGRLQVAAPAHARLADIRGFLSERSAWIQRKQRELQARPVAPAPVCKDGARLPFLGGELVLRQRPAARRSLPAVCEAGALWVAAVEPPRARALVEAWYRRAALDHVTQRVAHFAPQVGRAPARIRIRAQKTRWGSCSARGTISINWRLMQADAAIMDYVIVHELCHLLQPNHSSRFWREVGRVLPEYLRLRKRLRDFGRAVQF
jgi:predicted metal-dependent hydrolase